MECIHRPINVRKSIIKTANLGLRHKPPEATPTTSNNHDNSSVAMDIVMEGTSSEAVTKETSDEVTTQHDDTVTVSKGVTGCHGDTTTRTYTMDNSELSYAGSITMTTAQPATNITGHTGYLTFATLGPGIV